MDFSPFNYHLPKERIAQRPVYPYDQAKLLLIDEQLQEIVFSDIADSLLATDILVFNDTSVFPARLFGKFETGGGVEILLTEQVENNLWKVIARPAKKFKTGREVRFSEDLSAIVQERVDDYHVLLDFKYCGEGNFLDECGNMPIPPYIRDGKSDEQDRLDYQSLFAENRGSIAAPTASLHFTPSVIEAIRKKGVVIETLTLHVGEHSFLPAFQEDESLRKPGVEKLNISADLKERIAKYKAKGCRVIAVGTTVVRALESITEINSDAGETDLFIQPGFEFKVIDAMITNFHQPKSSHLLLVEAFMGNEKLEKSYQYALNNDFRFLSYGDAMFIKGNNA